MEEIIMGCQNENLRTNDLDSNHYRINKFRVALRSLLGKPISNRNWDEHPGNDSEFRRTGCYELGFYSSPKALCSGAFCNPIGR